MHKSLIALGIILIGGAEIFSPIDVLWTEWIQFPHYFVSNQVYPKLFQLLVIIFSLIALLYGGIKYFAPKGEKALPLLANLMLAVLLALFVMVLCSALYIIWLAWGHGLNFLINFIKLKTVYGLGLFAILLGILLMFKLRAAQLCGFFTACFIITILYTIPSYVKTSADFSWHEMQREMQRKTAPANDVDE